MRKAVRTAIKNYLWWAAHRVLRRHRPTIIAVTGSSGKTSTKFAIEAVLSTRHRAAAAPANLNTEIGVPLAILGLGFPGSPRSSWEWMTAMGAAAMRALYLKRTEEFLVLEYATNSPGDIGFLARQIPPDVAVVTSIGPAHIGRFASVEAIAAEKLGICAHLQNQRICILPAQALDFRLPSRKHAKIYFFGSRQFCSVIIKELAPSIDWKTVTPWLRGTLVLDGKTYRFRVPFLGRAYAAMVAIAVLIGEQFGVPVNKALAALKALKGRPGRAQLVRSRSGRVLIDDSYNANPQSMEGALETLKDVAQTRTRIAVLAPMRELGRFSHRLHTEVGKIARHAAHLVVAVGQGAQAYGATVWFETPAQAAEFLLSHTPTDAIVLIKGSHGAGKKPYLYAVVERLQLQ